MPIREAQTIAITGNRRYGKTTTLIYLGLLFKKAGYQVWADFPSCSFADKLFDSLLQMQEAEGNVILLADESHRLADNRLSMANTLDTWAFFLQGHFGKNVVIAMTIPFYLDRLAVIDPRIRLSFDFELRPKYNPDKDEMLIEFRLLEQGKYVFAPYYKRLVNVSQLWQFFDSKEKHLLTRRKHQGRVIKTIDKW